MKTVRIALDVKLWQAVDEPAQRLGISRSDFTREPLVRELEAISIRSLEAKRRGYETTVDALDELSEWEDERVWPD